MYRHSDELMHRRERYLTAATYISSRAFPSKLLNIVSGKPTETSAVQTSEEEESHPVLIPGMDMFNREPIHRDVNV